MKLFTKPFYNSLLKSIKNPCPILKTTIQTSTTPLAKQLDSLQNPEEINQMLC